MKTCIKCNVAQELICFNKSKRYKDGHDNCCKVCHAEYNKQHYLQNKQVYINRAKSNRDYTRDWWKTFKATFHCAICGNNKPWNLAFHHKDPSNKEYSLSQMINTKSKKAILNEIEKCMCVCHNCHADIHYNIRNGCSD